MDRQFRSLLHAAARRENLKVVAAKCDANYSTLATQLNPNNLGTEKQRALDVGELPELLLALDNGKPDSGALDAVLYLAQTIGAGVFRLPEVPGDLATNQLAEAIREFGELMQAHAEMDADRRRKPDEVEKVRREAHQAIASIQAYLAALEADAERGAQ